MFSNIILDVLHLAIPCTCCVCGSLRPYTPIPVCTMCEVSAPFTNMWMQHDNPMRQSLLGLLPVEQASAMFWYVEGSPWRKLIHRIKYDNRWSMGYHMGLWYGSMLKQSGLYDDVDMVVPVPLHPLRQMKRGYNQSAYIAEGIAKQLGVELVTSAVMRTRYNRSQTTRSHSERWSNVEGIFSVWRKKKLQGKHLLLVDDVFTTGATIISMGNTILRSVEDVRLSVTVLGVSRHSLHIKE